MPALGHRHDLTQSPGGSCLFSPPRATSSRQPSQTGAPPKPPPSHTFSEQSLGPFAGVSEPLRASPASETVEGRIPGQHKLKLNLTPKT